MLLNLSLRHRREYIEKFPFRVSKANQGSREFTLRQYSYWSARTICRKPNSSRMSLISTRSWVSLLMLNMEASELISWRRFCLVLTRVSEKCLEHRASWKTCTISELFLEYLKDNFLPHFQWNARGIRRTETRLTLDIDQRRSRRVCDDIG